MQTRKALIIDLSVAKTWFAAPSPGSPHTSLLTPQFSHLTPHTSLLTYKHLLLQTSLSLSTPSSSQLDAPPAKIAPATAALRFARALQEDLISFGSQKETPLGPRTRSRAALLCCLTSPRSLILHRNQPALALPPSTSLLRNVASYPTLSPRQLHHHLHLHLRPSSSIATFYNCTFNLLGRATHSVVVVAVSSSHAHSFSDGLRAARSEAQRSAHQ